MSTSSHAGQTGAGRFLPLSGIGFVVLIYVYFGFFLGPLNSSRDTMLATRC